MRREDSSQIMAPFSLECLCVALFFHQWSESRAHRLTLNCQGPLSEHPKSALCPRVGSPPANSLSCVPRCPHRCELWPLRAWGAQGA